jgi:ATP-dependent DNA ligase
MSTSIFLEKKSYDPLYGMSKDGKIKHWEICVEKFNDYSEIVTLHGYENKIETRVRVNMGKNIGKINETTHFQQATLEAQSKWKKKHDVEKYTKYPEVLYHPGTSKNEMSPMEYSNCPRLPMLAQDYSKHKNKLKYPCFIQPKLDGYRMIYNTTIKSITTRQGKNFEIVKESGLLYQELCSLPSGYILDGELYVHSDDVSFEALGVLRKTKKLTDEDKKNLSKIEYHVYDMIDGDLSFENRFEKIRELFDDKKYKMIRMVPTMKVGSEKEIIEYHQKFVDEDYEGSMLRNGSSKYLEKNRSYDLLKYKDFMDAEFEIVGYTFEKDTSGEDKNCVVWIVKIKEGLECKVRPKGAKEQRQELYELCEKDFGKFKGRKLWTKFFEYTSDGSLRFPTTKTSDVSSYIRDEVV